MVILAPQAGVFGFELLGAALGAAAPFPPWGRRRQAPPPGTEPLGMNPQLRGHCRGRPAAVEPQLNRALRSEEHTSELQSRFDLVCRLLLEKKKINSIFSI